MSVHYVFINVRMGEGTYISALSPRPTADVFRVITLEIPTAVHGDMTALIRHSSAEFITMRARFSKGIL